jgi:transcriptional regulator with XRE-family HTH domain
VVHVRAALRSLVKEHGGPSAVARLLKLSAAAISQITGEKNSPSLETAYRIAEVRGVHVVDVLEGRA